MPTDRNIMSDINAAAGRMAAQFGTHVKFVDFDGSNHDVKKYVGERYTPLAAASTVTSFSDISQTSKLFMVFQTEFNNKGDGVGELSHEFSQTETNSFSVSITEGITITGGIAVSGKASFKPFGVGGEIGAELSLSIGAEFSSTQAWSTEHAFTYTKSVGYQVPPRMKATVSWPIFQQNGRAVFHRQVRIENQVAIWFDKKIEISGGGKHHLWFVPVATLLPYGLADAGYQPAGGALIFNELGEGEVKVFTSGVATATTGPCDPSQPAGLGPVRQLDGSTPPPLATSALAA